MEKLSLEDRLKGPGAPTATLMVLNPREEMRNLPCDGLQVRGRKMTFLSWGDTTFPGWLLVKRRAVRSGQEDGLAFHSK